MEWPELREKLLRQKEYLSLCYDEWHRVDVSIPDSRYSPVIHEITSIIETGDLVDKHSEVLAGNPQEALEIILSIQLRELQVDKLWRKGVQLDI